MEKDRRRLTGFNDKENGKNIHHAAAASAFSCKKV
jgi:hypothetical protein